MTAYVLQKPQKEKGMLTSCGEVNARRELAPFGSVCHWKKRDLSQLARQAGLSILHILLWLTSSAQAVSCPRKQIVTSENVYVPAALCSFEPPRPAVLAFELTARNVRTRAQLASAITQLSQSI